jgi:hypothetical protein
MAGLTEDRIIGRAYPLYAQILAYFAPAGGFACVALLEDACAAINAAFVAAAADAALAAEGSG